MNYEELLRRLDRIERMLFDILSEEKKEEYIKEKIKEYKIALTKAEQELKNNED